jgi:hypothetical protein
MVQPYPSASTNAGPSVPCQVTSEQAWVLAPLIAGQPSYRTGRWIGTRFQYPRPKSPLTITKALPSRPAAVMVHGVDGSVATLCIDLDTSKAEPSVVRANASELCRLFSTAGLRFVEDFSPSGGQHIYVPLAERMDGAAARELVEALTYRAASLDPGPHQNLTDGCIRVPGSAHKRGGHQVLLTPLSEAYDIMRRRNAPSAVERLRRALAPELHRLRAKKSLSTAAGPLTRTVAGSVQASSLPLRQVAFTGLYDTSIYPSPSEARMAVLNHFVGCGTSLEQLREALPVHFPGLAALYKGGQADKQDRLLEKEWDRAQAHVTKSRHSKGGKRYASISNTSQPSHRGGSKAPRGGQSKQSIHQLVNDLENVVYAVLDDRLKTRGREGLSLRLLIRSLLGFMRTMETDVVDVGCRSLALAIGKSHVTVARLLPVLVDASDGILTKVADARRKCADVYTLQLPEKYQELARELSWRKGKIHGIRHVFRALGDPAALVYEAIERGRLSPTNTDIIRSTGLSRSSVERALAEMAGLGMIHRNTHSRRWYITAAANLGHLAYRLGVMDAVQAQKTLYKKQRARWHAWLDRFKTDQESRRRDEDLHDSGVEIRLREEDFHDLERDEYWLPYSEDPHLPRRVLQLA